MSRGKGRSQKAEGRSVLVMRALVVFVLLPSAFCLLTSCRQKMAVQPRYDPLEPSDFFADHMASRPRIAGTVARRELAVTGPAATGKTGTVDVDAYHIAVTDPVLN